MPLSPNKKPSIEECLYALAAEQVIDFINSALPKSFQIKEYEFLDLYSEQADIPENFNLLLHIYAKTEKGGHFWVELQKSNQPEQAILDAVCSEFLRVAHLPNEGFEPDLPVFVVSLLEACLDTNLPRTLRRVSLTSEDKEVLAPRINYLFVELADTKSPADTLASSLDKWVFLFNNCLTLKTLPDNFEPEIFQVALDDLRFEYTEIPTTDADSKPKPAKKSGKEKSKKDKKKQPASDKKEKTPKSNKTQKEKSDELISPLVDQFMTETLAVLDTNPDTNTLIENVVPAQIRLAQKMKKAGISLKKIRKHTGLSKKTILKL